MTEVEAVAQWHFQLQMGLDRAEHADREDAADDAVVRDSPPVGVGEVRQLAGQALVLAPMHGRPAVDAVELGPRGPGLLDLLVLAVPYGLGITRLRGRETLASVDRAGLLDRVYFPKGKPRFLLGRSGASGGCPASVLAARLMLLHHDRGVDFDKSVHERRLYITYMYTDTDT